MSLIDRDKLILYLNDWAYSIAPDYVREDVLVEEVIRGIEYNTIMRVIEAIDKVPTVNQWIPCKERTPNDDTEVLACNIHGDIYMLRFKGDMEYCEDYWMDENEEIKEDIIAWQPLPPKYEG